MLSLPGTQLARDLSSECATHHWQRCRSPRVPLSGCQQPHRLEVLQNFCAWHLAHGVTHFRAYSLIRTITSVRENRARAEGLEQTEQFAQLTAIYGGWWARHALLQPTRARWAVWSEDLDQGNLEREAEIVPSVALAEMQHSKSTPAPSGPPGLTADAWLSGHVEMTGAPSSTHGEGPIE